MNFNPSKPTKRQLKAIQALFASPLQSGKIRLAAFRYLRAVEEAKDTPKPQKAPKIKKTRNKLGLLEVPCRDKYL